MKFDKYCTGCEDCNRRIPLFGSLTEDELKLLNKDRYSVRFHEGEVILKQGTRVDYQVSVVDGFAKMYIEGYQNRNLILDFLKPTKLISSTGIQSNSKLRFNVVAVRETLVCFIDLNNFKAVLASNSTAALAFDETGEAALQEAARVAGASCELHVVHVVRGGGLAPSKPTPPSQ